MKKDIISYAQEYEDVILFHALRNEEEVFWVDVGANDPVYHSVTKLFYDMGGHGINIEPLSNFYNKLVDERPRDINLNIGASNESGVLELSGNDVYATFDAERNIRPDHNMILRKEVEVKTLKTVLNEWIGDSTVIHFLKIDVEGWERNVLLGMDFNLYRPWIVCIEAIDPEDEKNIYKYGEWESILIKNGYILAKAVGINRFYTLREKRGLNKKIKSLGYLSIKYNILDQNGNKSVGGREIIAKDLYYKEGFSLIRNFYRRMKMKIVE